MYSHTLQCCQHVRYRSRKAICDDILFIPNIHVHRQSNSGLSITNRNLHTIVTHSKALGFKPRSRHKDSQPVGFNCLDARYTTTRNTLNVVLPRSIQTHSSTTQHVRNTQNAHRSSNWSRIQNNSRRYKSTAETSKVIDSTVRPNTNKNASTVSDPTVLPLTSETAKESSKDKKDKKKNESWYRPIVYSGRTALETAFDGMTKGMVPEVKHSEAKHRIRAANAIRRKSAPYPGSYEWVNEAVEKVEGEAREKARPVPKGILETGSAFASKDEGREGEFDDEDKLLRTTPQVSMRTLFELLRPETTRMGVAMGAVLVSSLASLAFPSAVGQVVDSVSATNPDGPSFETAQQIILTMLGVVGIGSTAVAVRVSQLNIVSEQVARTLRKNVFESMIYQKMRFFEENETGRLVNRLSTDTAMVASTLTDNVARVIKAGTAVCTSTGFLLNISPQLTGVTMLVLPMFGVAAYTYGEYRKKLAQILLTRYAKENQVSMERLQGIRTVHSFTAEAAEVERYRYTVDRSFGLAKKVGNAEGLFLAGGFAVAQCTLLGVLYYGGSLMVQDALSVGQLTSFCMYTGYLFVSVGQVSVATSEFLKAQGAARRVFSVIDTSNLNRHIYPMKDPEGAIMPDMTNFSPDIVLKNVNFAYPTRPDIQVLKNVNLSLEAGHTLAICGTSGSGKSTLGLLIGQYYDVDNGSVTIGGYEASKLPLMWLRENIAEVTQMPLLFSGTVKDNIRYGNPNATDEQIYEAAKTANAHGFIEKLPNGYDTQCGERGKALSGGQMQRVCIARAVVKDSPIYIMDEATSALDAESEHLVVEALQKVMKGRTAIVFTHHLNVLRAADMVAVMDSGKVVQAGAYDDLIQQEGPLKRIAATLQ